MTTVDDLVVSTNNISLSSNPKELIPKSTPPPLQPLQHLQQSRQYIQNETKQRYSFRKCHVHGLNYPHGLFDLDTIQLLMFSFLQE